MLYYYNNPAMYSCMKSGKSCVRDLLVTLTQPIPIEISSILNTYIKVLYRSVR